MSDLTIHLEGKEYALDDFTLGELEYLEDELGGSLEEEGRLSSMKAAVRLVMVIKRREDATFSLEQARALKLTVFDGNEEEAKPSPPRKRAKPA